MCKSNILENPQCAKVTNINSCNPILSKFRVMRRPFGTGPSGPIIALDLSAATLLFLSQLLPYHRDSRIMIYFRLRLMLGCEWTLGRCTGVHCTRGDIPRRTSRARRSRKRCPLKFLDIESTVINPRAKKFWIIISCRNI